MAKALIIKNANFSVNKVTTITFEEEVPCTGISLNNNTLALTQVGGTATLTATPLPSGTTDSVIWGSSNLSVATVAGGVITATGCGTATITAACGNFSATCTVTVTHIANVSFAKNTSVGKDANKDYLTGGLELDKYAVGYSAEGTLKLTHKDLQWYGVAIPNGASTIVVTAPGAYQTYGFWVSRSEHSAGTAGVALAYPADANWSGAEYTGPRTVTIPDRTTGDYEGMDAAAFMFRYNATVEDSDVESISIVFN